MFCIEMCDKSDLTHDLSCKKVASATYDYFGRNCSCCNWDLSANTTAIE